jgi:hypothetical protein
VKMDEMCESVTGRICFTVRFFIGVTKADVTFCVPFACPVVGLYGFTGKSESKLDM